MEACPARGCEDRLLIFIPQVIVDPNLSGSVYNTRRRELQGIAVGRRFRRLSWRPEIFFRVRFILLIIYSKPMLVEHIYGLFLGSVLFDR